MSLFICAHGELYSKCKYCSEFNKKDSDSESEQDEKWDDPILSKIVTMMRKEKIEY